MELNIYLENQSSKSCPRKEQITIQRGAKSQNVVLLNKQVIQPRLNSIKMKNENTNETTQKITMGQSSIHLCPISFHFYCSE